MTSTLDRPQTPVISGAPTAGTSSAAGPVKPPKVRDGFLDTVRAVALIRVIIWHTLALTVVSWIVASMPAMFFVAGSLLARGLDRQPLKQLYTTRLKRLLIPFWSFAAVVLTVLVVVHHLDPTAANGFSSKSLLPWIFPIVDPHGNAWEAGWASTPLWYLRCYLWLLLLSPLLRKAHRRWGLKILVVPIVLVFVLDYYIRHPESDSAVFHAVRYYLADVTTFSIFWILGFSHSDGAIAGLDRRARLEWAAIGAAGALVWVKFIAPSSLVVNDSYPLTLFVGIAWLGVFLAAEQWIGRATQHGILGPIVRWLGRRSLTVYLWHPIAIVGAYWLRSILFPHLPRVAVLPVVFLLVVVLCVLFGRIEDYSAGRAAQWWPGRDDPVFLQDLGSRIGRFLPHKLSPVRALVIGTVVGIVLLGVVVPTPNGSADKEDSSSGNGLALPPAPSAKPDQANFGTSPTTTAPTTAGTDAAAAAGSDGGAAAADGGAAAVVPASGAAAVAPASGAAAVAPASGAAAVSAAAPASGASGAAAAGAGAVGTGTITPVGSVAQIQQRIQSAVDSWRTSKGVAGAEMGVMLPDGSSVTVVSGKNTNGSVLDPSVPFPVTSITKTMTSAITLQLVKEGKIGLDDMLPEITAVPGLPYVGKVTIRQILNHTAGIQPYDTTPGYATAKNTALTPETALQLVMHQPLQWTPGTKDGYSNSGYLTLGLLDAQLSGSTYPQLLQTQVFGPAGMTDSSLNTTPTAGWSGFSAGGVDSTLHDLLAWGDALYRKGKILDSASLGQMLNIGNQFNAGLGAFPDCPCSTVNGVKVYSSIGHNGGQATLQWAPKQNVVIALNLTESLWTTHLTQVDVETLLTAVEAAVTA